MTDARRQTPDARTRQGGSAPFHAVRKLGSSRTGFLGAGRFGRKAPRQTREHSLDVLQFGNYWRHSFLVGQTQKYGHQQVGLQFTSGTQGDVDEAAELSIPEPAASLGDIRCDRQRGTSTLRYEPESLGLGKVVGDAVDAVDNHPTSLPDLELPKVLHTPLLPTNVPQRNALVSRCGTSHTSGTSYNASGVWRLAYGALIPLRAPSRSGTCHRASGRWRLTPGVFVRFEGSPCPSTANAPGVWRLASGVSSSTDAAYLR